MKEIFERRSVREFLQKEVEKEKIDKLLKSAMQAPSAMNEQPWEFIVVDDKNLLQEISKIGMGAEMVKEAPLAIVILADEKKFTLKYKNIKEYFPPKWVLVVKICFLKLYI